MAVFASRGGSTNPGMLWPRSRVKLRNFHPADRVEKILPTDLGKQPVRHIALFVVAVSMSLFASATSHAQIKSLHRRRRRPVRRLGRRDAARAGNDHREVHAANRRPPGHALDHGKNRPRPAHLFAHPTARRPAAHDDRPAAVAQLSSAECLPLAAGSQDASRRAFARHEHQSRRARRPSHLVRADRANGRRRSKNFGDPRHGPHASLPDARHLRTGQQRLRRQASRLRRCRQQPAAPRLLRQKPPARIHNPKSAPIRPRAPR